MPRTEARIFSSIWRDGDFLQLPAGAQRLYLFLLSQDDLTLCGVLALREARWAGKAADTTRESVDADLDALERQRFVLTDRSAGELLIRSLMRRDEVWKQWPLLEAARKSSATVQSEPIRHALAEELKRIRASCDVRGKASEVLDHFMADIADENFLPDQSDNHPDEQGASGVIAERSRSDREVQGKGERGSPTGTASTARARELNVGDVVAAYMDGARGGGQPAPAASLRARVGRQAKQMLAEGYSIETLVASARTMGAGEWNDLAVQVRKDAAASNGSGRPNASSNLRKGMTLVAQYEEEERRQRGEV